MGLGDIINGALGSVLQRVSSQQTQEQESERRKSQQELEKAGRTSSYQSVSITSVVQPVEVRAQRLKLELLASNINIHNLKRLAFNGIPDQDNLRAITWKASRGGGGVHGRGGDGGQAGW